MDYPEESDEYHAVLELDGLAYWLVAVRTYGGYHAAWGCDLCNEAHYCGLHNEAAEGMQASKDHARSHHEKLHSSPPSRPR